MCRFANWIWQIVTFCTPSTRFKFDYASYFAIIAFNKYTKVSVKGVGVFRHVCAISPTGYDKSLLFVLPALVSNLITLVILLLVSLINTQKFQLKEWGCIERRQLN